MIFLRSLRGDYGRRSPQNLVETCVAELDRCILRRGRENMPYIHERSDWPKIDWDREIVGRQLAEVRHRQGRIVGRMEGLGFELQAEASLQSLTEEVVKSSEIEGEFLDRDQVRSSLARRLGMDIGGLIPADRNVEGVVEMMLDATQNYATPLTKERLFDWHAALFPTGRSGMSRITVGGWRTEKFGTDAGGVRPIRT